MPSIEELQVLTCSSFCICGGMIMNKPFKSLEEQLDILKDRGMKIHDYEFSKRILHLTKNQKYIIFFEFYSFLILFAQNFGYFHIK